MTGLSEWGELFTEWMRVKADIEFERDRCLKLGISDDTCRLDYLVDRKEEILKQLVFDAIRDNKGVGVLDDV